MAKMPKKDLRNKPVKQNSKLLKDPVRRDFLYLATGAVAAVGVANVAWPLIDQMNPDASMLALSSIEVDIGAVQEGQSITVQWRGKPVFIRHRTKKEIAEAKEVVLETLPEHIIKNSNLRVINISFYLTVTNHEALVVSFMITLIVEIGKKILHLHKMLEKHF